MIIFEKRGGVMKKTFIIVLILCILALFSACAKKNENVGIESKSEEAQEQNAVYQGAFWVSYSNELYSELFNYDSGTGFLVPIGTVIAFDRQENHWYHVNYKGNEGWLWVEDPDFFCASHTVRDIRVTVQEGLEVYKSPNNESAVISKIEKESVVSVIVGLHNDWVNNWSYTKVNGVYGWVKADYGYVEFIDGSEKKFEDIFGKTVIEAP